MGLTEEIVLNYLLEVRTLSEIDNHAVRGDNGSKAGQTPLTLQISKQLIDEILERDAESEPELLTANEKKALINLYTALNSLPSVMSFQALRSLFEGLDHIQNSLFFSVTFYLESITAIDAHKTLLKAVVLVLKIIEYDLSKNDQPISIGYGFFKKQILSVEQKAINHGKVQLLLAELIKRFDLLDEQEQDLDQFQQIVSA